MMFSFLYDICLAFWMFFMLPKWLYKMRKGDRFSFREQLGIKISNFNTPCISGKKIWICAPSVGEVKAIIPLIHELKATIPHLCIFLSTFSKAGYELGKSELSNLVVHFRMPLDFSWTIKRIYRLMQPELVLSVETGFWYHFIRYAPKFILINGKISYDSFKKFSYFSFVSDKIFERVGLFCLQNETYAERFLKLGVPAHKIAITGNLKWDQQPSQIALDEWKKTIGFSSESIFVTIASTHEKEEEMLLSALDEWFHQSHHVKILLAPRHPERFKQVAQWLSNKKIPFQRLSEIQKSPIHCDSSKIILIDQMGVLAPCFQISKLAILGGSFIDHIGGHNIFEPIVMGTPVIFGPFMHNQEEMVELILKTGAGKQVRLDQLSTCVSQVLEDPLFVEMKDSGSRLKESVKGSTARTLEKIVSFF